MLEPFSNKF